MHDTDLMSAPEVAAALDISIDWVKRLEAQGSLPKSVRLGPRNARFFGRTQIEAIAGLRARARVEQEQRREEIRALVGAAQ